MFHFLRAHCPQGEQAIFIHIGNVEVLFHHSIPVAFSRDGDPNTKWALAAGKAKSKTTRALQSRHGYTKTNMVKSEHLFLKLLMDALGKNLPQWGALIAQDEAEALEGMAAHKKEVEAAEKLKCADVPGKVIAFCDAKKDKPLLGRMARLMAEKRHMPKPELCEYAWQKLFAEDATTTFLDVKVACEEVGLIVRKIRKDLGLEV